MSTRPVPGPAGANAVAHVFVESLDDRCEITGDDGHHLQRVRRLTPGECVTAADDSGAWRHYEIAEIADRRLVLEATAPTQVTEREGPGVALAVALTKGGLDDVVAATTELGVARVTPVRTERVVVRWDDARAIKAVARLRVVAREAAMQSRRVRVPVVDDVVDVARLRDRPGLVVANAEGVAPWDLPPVPPAPGTEAWTVLVGPEGGLTPGDLASLATAPRVRLAPNVLRAAHAPVAAVAVLLQELGRRQASGGRPPD